MTRKPVAFGYRHEVSGLYLLQVTTFRSPANDDYVTHTLTFLSKPDAIAFAKRAGMSFTS